MSTAPDANDLESVRRTALDFLAHCFGGRVDAVLAMLAPEATWWVLGDPQKIRVSGTRNVAEVARFLKNVRRGFPDGLQFTIEGVTAEGERVAVEASSSARMANGEPYANRYHFLVRVRDGHVVEMREYLDTHQAFEAQQASGPLPPAR